MAERRARGARRSTRPHSKHFLRSQALAAELVHDAGLQPDELVLDLGAGSGRLTAELAGAARHVLAVELDAGLADRLRGRWANVEVVQGDAASVELPREAFRVIANLPFDRTTAILNKDMLATPGRGHEAMDGPDVRTLRQKFCGSPAAGTTI